MTQDVTRYLQHNLQRFFFTISDSKTRDKEDFRIQVIRCPKLETFENIFCN